MYKNRKTSIIGMIITICILIVIVTISNMKLNNWSYISNKINSVIMPVQNGFVYLKNKISKNNDFFISIDNLKSEKENLEKENQELKEQVSELGILKAENETLKEFMDLKDKYDGYTVCPAYIIQKDITNYNRVFTINVGKQNGVDVNMAVVSEKGLVGVIISASETTAKVQTVIDTATVVSSTISSTDDGIVTRGMLDSENQIKATFIPTDANIIVGDVVKTSGLGGIYPKGIKIGTVTKIVETENIIDRYAIIDTAVDFAKMSSVLVIIK